jgi:membrane-associated phospholipid phosphatase
MLLLVLLVTATALVPWGRAVDLSVHSWAVTHRAAAVVSVATGVTSLGTSWVTVPAVVLVAFAAMRADVRGRLVRAAAVLAVMTAGVLCRSAMAVLIGRARPPQQDWAANASGLSFPSGHSADAALAAGLIAWLITDRIGPRLEIWVVATFYALVVGATRVYLGMHWTTDVLGGWTFAAAWLATALALRGLRYGVVEGP